MSRVREESISGVKWQLISRLTLQPTTFIFGMILARLITPEEMGIIALTSIFFAVASQLKDCGFGAALLRKQERTEEDINTVFWFNVGMSFLVCVALCLLAPWFAFIFNQPALVELTYISALMMFLNSSASVHWTLYAAKRDFKTTAIVSTVTTIIPMPFTIWAAFSGWSYWALVFQGVTSSMLSLLTIWIISPWKPRFLFSKASCKNFFGFGSKLFLTGLIDISYAESRNLILGKFYSADQLAFFHRGFKLADLPRGIFQGIISSIAFPILSTLQSDESRLIEVYRKYFRLCMLLTLCFMIALAANAPSVIFTLYGETWMTAASYAQILVFGIMFNPTTTLIISLLFTKGRTDLVLRISVIVRILGIVSLVVASFFSVEAICYAAVFTGTLHMVLSILTIAREGWIPMKTQLQDLSPYLIIALIANAPPFILNYYFAPSYVLFVVGLTISLGIFISVMRWRYDSTWQILIELLKEKRLLRFAPWLSRKPHSKI